MKLQEKIDTMTDEQANTFFGFFIEIKVLDPIQTILHKLENCEYRDVELAQRYNKFTINKIFKRIL